MQMLPKGEGMRHEPLIRAVAVCALLLASSSGVAAGQSGLPSAARLVQPGEWEFKGTDGRNRRVCVSDPATLFQLGHERLQCSRVVVESAERSATVRYACQGHGNGRTTLTVDTGSVVTLDTQGVIDGTPFSEQYEARRVGTCR
jgi:hypothetical protein